MVDFLGMYEQYIGWAGNGLLALCSIPQGIKCIRNGHAKGLDPWFLWMWYLGEMMAFTYHLHTSTKLPQVVNYTINILMITIIVWYKYFPRNNNGMEKQDSTVKKDDKQQVGNTGL